MAWIGRGIQAAIELQPLYQQGLVTQSTQFRTIPDVSMLADPNTGVAVYDSCGQILTGGRSSAEPAWRALDLEPGSSPWPIQGRVAGRRHNLDGPSETLPKIYSLSSTDFHDITTGNNGFCRRAGV